MSTPLAPARSPIAVVGVSALFPGSTDSTGFWLVMARRFLFSLLRLVTRMLIHLNYRFSVRRQGEVPAEGAVVLVANHVSYIDALFVAASVNRPIRFVMSAKIYSAPLARHFFGLMGAIPIASRRDDPETLALAYERIAAALEADEAVCIFPEGHLTHDGEVDQFRQGIERIVERTPVPVVPMALRGLWGSMFSRKDNKVRRALSFPLRTASEVIIGTPVPASEVAATTLHVEVCGLRGAFT